QALQAVDAALAIARDTGDRRFEADALNTAGAIRCQLGEPAVAIDHHTRALHLARKTKCRTPETLALIGLAGAYRQLGQNGHAARRARAALSLAERYGLRLLADRARAIRTAAEPAEHSCPGGRRAGGVASSADEASPLTPRRRRAPAPPVGWHAAATALAAGAGDEPARRVRRRRRPATLHQARGLSSWRRFDR